jgi:hypothetical protein
MPPLKVLTGVEFRETTQDSMSKKQLVLLSMGELVDEHGIVQIRHIILIMMHLKHTQ